MKSRGFMARAMNPKVIGAALVATALCCTPASARDTEPSISITVDTSVAERTLDLLCSQRPVNERRIRSSPIVQAQIAHNSSLRASATMDAYIAGLRAISSCQAPPRDDDVFGVAAILENPDEFRTKVAALSARQEELASAVAQRLSPYAPAGTRFHRAVILAVPYFSCGGFERGEYFFIDIQCLDDDIDNDFEALEVLVVHEAFHGLQARMFYSAPLDARDITDVNSGLQYLFGTMIREGTATYVSGAAALLNRPAGGPLTRLSQSYGRQNAARLRHNFHLLTILFGYVAAASPQDARARAETVEDLAFDGGAFEEFGYYVGARMAGDIEQAWGREALVCVMQLPPEQFVLAHDAATPPDALKLGPHAVSAARTVALARGGDYDFASCRAAPS